MSSSEVLREINSQFKKDFYAAFTGVKPTYNRIAMTVNSNTSMNTYAWLGQFPKMKKWIGERKIEQINKTGMSLINEKYENTVSIPREQFEDDQVGMYRPVMAEMGRSAAELPEDLVWSLLPKLNSTLCYDGQNFFDTDHPVYEKVDGTGAVSQVSNFTTGTQDDAPTFYVIDDTRAIKPIIYQNRTQAEFEVKTDPGKSEAAFMKDEYLYGTRKRCAVGPALWQLAHRVDKTELTAESLNAVIVAMRTMDGNGSKRLGIRPSLLIVPPEVEDKARLLLQAGTVNGTTNITKNKLKLHVCDWL